MLTPPRPSPASTNNKGMNQVEVIWCVTAVMCGGRELAEGGIERWHSSSLCRGFVNLINRLGLTSSGTVWIQLTSEFDITAPAAQQLRFVLYVYT